MMDPSTEKKSLKSEISVLEKILKEKKDRLTRILTIDEMVREARRWLKLRTKKIKIASTRTSAAINEKAISDNVIRTIVSSIIIIKAKSKYDPKVEDLIKPKRYSGESYFRVEFAVCSPSSTSNNNGSVSGKVTRGYAHLGHLKSSFLEIEDDLEKIMNWDDNTGQTSQTTLRDAANKWRKDIINKQQEQKLLLDKSFSSSASFLPASRTTDLQSISWQNIGIIVAAGVCHLVGLTENVNVKKDCWVWNYITTTIQDGLSRLPMSQEELLAAASARGGNENNENDSLLVGNSSTNKVMRDNISPNGATTTGLNNTRNNNGESQNKRQRIS